VQEPAAVAVVATDHLNVKPLPEDDSANPAADARASGCFRAPRKTPHKMGSQKGNVKIRRRVGRPQVIERIGSSGRIRTYNPPVNSVEQVIGLAGSSCR
jgi:hypothetical protein